MCSYAVALRVTHFNNLCRIYDLSSDIERPEQEYFLQPVEAGRCKNAASVCPVAFSFGGEHLWDRFTVSTLVNGLVFLNNVKLLTLAETWLLLISF